MEAWHRVEYMKVSDILFPDYSVMENILSSIRIPRMFKVKQCFNNETVTDVYAETLKQLHYSGYGKTIKPGMKICITASSRGIDRQREIIKAIVDYVKELSGLPFVIPAMGSHGGATDEGQLEILRKYGIEESYIGCPIKSSMETVRIGYVEDMGKTLPAYVDKYAYEADGVIVFNRVKPHSAFRGPYESGLMKMMSIGIGNQKGAETVHNDGFGTFHRRIFLFGDYVRRHLTVLFSVATVENSYDKCSKIEIIATGEIPAKEKELLRHAFSLMPKIFVSDADILVVGQIGKNFSGSGMDPNITGTWATEFGSGGLNKQRVVVLDLSDESNGNALGMGNADIITKKLFDKIDFMEMYPNVLTNTVFKTIKVPMVLKDDEMCIRAAIKTCNGINYSSPRIVYIKNSLEIDEILLSEAYWDEISQNADIQILTEPKDLIFENGMINL